MTTTYTFEQLKEDVKKEAEALRVHATKEELGRLDFETFRASHMKKDIYGQITFACDSDKACKLMTKCAPRFLKRGNNSQDLIPVEVFSKSHWSPIELYCMEPEARNANLIAYLRGETDTLDL